MHTDIFKIFSRLEQSGRKFDIVLLDPPYHGGMAKKVLIKLDSHDILTPPCIIVVEHHRKEALPKQLGRISVYRTVRYGDICLSFYGLRKRTG